MAGLTCCPRGQRDRKEKQAGCVSWSRHRLRHPRLCDARIVYYRQTHHAAERFGAKAGTVPGTLRLMLRGAAGIPILICCQLCWAQQEEIPVFGTTVVLPSGLKGEVYNLKANTAKLPNFRRMKPVGVIYTNSLNIAPREFTAGFPGVTERFEWFAIDYTGRFWIDQPGAYRFELTSDDGSKLYVDDRLLIDNDGGHIVQARMGETMLSGGIHGIRVSYFQGRRYHLALILKVKGPGDSVWQVFSTEALKPPAHPEDWKFGGEKDLDKAPLRKK
jgi:hypothetical protein